MNLINGITFLLVCQIVICVAQNIVLLRDLVARSLPTDTITFQSCCLNTEESKIVINAMKEGMIRATTVALLAIFSPSVDPKVLNEFNVNLLALSDKDRVSSTLSSILKSINFGKESHLSFLHASLLLIIQNHLLDNTKSKDIDSLSAKISAFTAMNVHVQKVIIEEVFSNLKSDDGKLFVTLVIKGLHGEAKCGNDEYIKWLQNKDDIFFHYVKDILQTLAFFLNDMEVQLASYETFKTATILTSVLLNQKVDIVLLQDGSAMIDNKAQFVSELLYGVPLIQMGDVLCYMKLGRSIREKNCCTSFTRSNVTTKLSTTLRQTTATIESTTIQTTIASKTLMDDVTTTLQKTTPKLETTRFISTTKAEGNVMLFYK